MTVSNVYVSEKNKNGILNGSNSHLAKYENKVFVIEPPGNYHVCARK